MPDYKDILLKKYNTIEFSIASNLKVRNSFVLFTKMLFHGSIYKVLQLPSANISGDR